ncbi:MAG: HIT domain-containing protein [DPANN group archaeon]|nr:HIT domain-containing protein [DPANN group archaeon]
MAQLSEEQLKALNLKVQEIAKLPPEEQAERAQELLTPEEMEFLKEQQALRGQGGGCVFCGIAQGKIPTKIVYEDNDFIAFLSKDPANPGHTFLAPKEHIPLLAKLPDNLASRLLILLRNVSAAVYDAVSAQGISVLQQNGPAAGQTIPHMIFNIVPRFDNDKVVIDMPNIDLTEEQMSEFQQRIAENMKKFGTAATKPEDSTPKKPIKFRGRGP